MKTSGSRKHGRKPGNLITRISAGLRKEHSRTSKHVYDSLIAGQLPKYDIALIRTMFIPRKTI
jgi:hypothetical protein